jgi:hypothetical protein
MAFLTAIRARQRAGQSMGGIVSSSQKLGDGRRVQSWADKDFHSMGSLCGVYVPTASSSLGHSSRWSFPLASPFCYDSICCDFSVPRPISSSPVRWRRSCLFPAIALHRTTSIPSRNSVEVNQLERGVVVSSIADREASRTFAFQPWQIPPRALWGQLGIKDQRVGYRR